jgi:transposase
VGVCRALLVAAAAGSGAAPARSAPGFDALKWIAWTGAPWRALPHDFPPWAIVYQQAMRWLAAGVFEAMVHDLRVLLRDFTGRKKPSAAAILDGRTVPPAVFETPGWSLCGLGRGWKLLGSDGGGRPEAVPLDGKRSFCTVPIGA